MCARLKVKKNVAVIFFARARVCCGGSSDKRTRALNTVYVILRARPLKYGRVAPAPALPATLGGAARRGPPDGAAARRSAGRQLAKREKKTARASEKKRNLLLLLLYIKYWSVYCDQYHTAGTGLPP